MQQETRYVGQRTKSGCEVTKVSETGESKPLEPRLDIHNHSPSGFEFGYPGSGPAQLALAILADVAGDRLAHPLQQEFKRDVIARIEGDHFELTAEAIEQWV